jgi:hypothetical protein
MPVPIPSGLEERAGERRLSYFQKSLELLGAWCPLTITPIHINVPI